ncbi:abortive infection bacteriophage resistance protein (plasmid) [Bacillus cereus E33L]|uniref:Abortive infection bacteriophage resistance protein n=2 Tax=Bacillus cereus TaxID=1396 RepID=Q4V0V7_BACCZ|nr:abortive infection bacteriophage resistance protein [Bacillus cereus E33L]
MIIMFLFKEIERVLEATNNQAKEVYIFNRSTEEMPMNEYKTVGQIIEELSMKVDYPLVFSADEKEMAKEFLVVHNYYSFQIYRKFLPRIEGKEYSFTDCLILYQFNDFLREGINKFAGVVELLFRSTLVTHLCSHYDGDFHKGEFYLDKSIYAKESLANEILMGFSNRIKESKSDAVIHHIRNKNRAIPFWVIVEEATFGELYHFVTCLNQEYRYHWIDQAFGKQYRKFIMGWVKSVNIMRNTCAHYGRLYARYFSAAPPKLLKEDMMKADIKGDQNKTLFAQLLTLKHLITYNSFYHDEWNSFIDTLNQAITKNKGNIILSRMKFPVNWKECLLIKED